MPKWMRALSAAVAALAAAWLLALVPWGGRGREAISPPESPVKISVAGPSRSVTIEKRDGTWRVVEPLSDEADEGTVLGALSALKVLAVEDEVTRRAEEYSRYELEEGKAVRLRAWGAGRGEPFEVSIGKNAGFTGRAYVRVGGGPAVRLAAGLSREAVDLPLERWRDRRVVRRSDVVRVRVTRGRKSFEVAQTTAGWTVDGASADADRASSFFSAVRTLAGDDLVDPPAALDLKAHGLDAPSAVFDVSFSTGAPLSFSVGKGTPLPVKRAGEGTLYMVPPYRAAELSRGAEDLIPQ